MHTEGKAMNRIRKAATTALLGATLAATGLVTASPAEAATGTYFCFGWASTGTAYANYPVHLWRVNSLGAKVTYLRPGRTASNGCATFYNTPSGVNLRVFVDFYPGFQAFHGATPRMATPGSGTANLGTGWVY